MSVQHAGSIIRQARLNAGLPRNNYPMESVLPSLCPALRTALPVSALPLFRL